MAGKGNRSIVFRSVARLEFFESVEWYEKQQAGLGLRFEAAVDAQLQKILQAPEMFRLVRGEIRRAVLREFPYTIHFLTEPERLVIIAVFHAKRSPAELQERR